MKTKSAKNTYAFIDISSGRKRTLPNLAHLKKNKISLVLSGGGMHGLAQLGVIEHLEQNNIQIDECVGCSIGSLIGVCLAAGKKSHEIKDFLYSASIYSYFVPSLRGGLLNSEKLVNAILKFANVTNFTDLQMPFKINATNVNTGAEKIFSKGSLFTALQASMTFPGMFVPVKIGAHYFIDGGVVSTLPLHLANSSNVIIAIDVSRRGEKITSSSNSFQVLESGLMLMQQKETTRLINEIKSVSPLIVIRPNVSSYLFFEIRKSIWNKIYDVGLKSGEYLLKKLN